MGVMSGGRKLLEKLRQIGKKTRTPHDLRVGFLEGATYEDSGIRVAQVAFWLNYGSKTAPPRPFFTDLITEKQDKWSESLGRLIMLHDYNVEKALALMGEGIVGQIQQAIVDMDSPPLSKITLMLRKMKGEDSSLEVSGATIAEAARRVASGESTAPASEKVGVFTGHMLNSVGYQIDGGAEITPGEQ